MTTLTTTPKARPTPRGTVTITPRAMGTTTSRASTSTSGTTRTPSSTSPKRSPSTSASFAPDHAADFTANAEAFVEQIAGLEDALGQIEAKDAGAKVFVTEPVPVYLVEAAGLTNATPSAFSEAVEEGQDVPPATLLESLQLIDSGEIAVMIVNPQTGGAETTQVMDEAKAKSIPVLEFTETLPEGETYVSWMQSNITALSDALAA